MTTFKELYAPRPVCPVFRPDPTFRYDPPFRPCGLLGRPLVTGCVGCRRCPDAPSSAEEARAFLSDLQRSGSDRGDSRFPPFAPNGCTKPGTSSASETGGA